MNVKTLLLAATMAATSFSPVMAKDSFNYNVDKFADIAVLRY